MPFPLQTNPRRWTLLLVVLSALFCLALAILSGVNSIRRLTRISEDIFNQRQLLQARKIASDLQERIYDLQMTLLSMNEIVRSLKGQSLRETALPVLFTQIRHFGLSEFQALDEGGRTIFSLGLEETPPARIREVMSWARSQKNDGTLFVSQPFQLMWQADNHRHMLIAAPTILATGEFRGICFLRIMADLLVDRVVEGVRAGGDLAWVFDQSGDVLTQRNAEWLEQEGLLIWKEPPSPLSDQEIELLATEFLVGEREGTFIYETSGPPGGKGRIKKLAAYAQVRFFDRPGIPDTNPSYSPTFLTAAVVTPSHKASGLIREALLQDLAVVGLLILVIVASAIVAIYATLHWSSTLQSEVDRVKKELGESQQRLLLAERLASIGKAAAILSHEIKNPLLVIGGFARRLAEKLKGDEGSHDKLMLITREVDRLESLLGEVKDITRQVPLKLEKVHINNLVGEVLELLERELQEEKIEIVLGSGPEAELGFCFLDPNRIKQVLINLLKNSAEAMPEGGRIAVRTSRERDYQVVEIEDNGKGIRPEDLAEIFNPFFSTKQKGTGLGLAVSLKIVEDHGGDLRVSSEVGHGTIFKMRLPCNPPTPPGSAA